MGIKYVESVAELWLSSRVLLLAAGGRRETEPLFGEEGWIHTFEK
jgi:hypothetical protein